MFLVVIIGKSWRVLPFIQIHTPSCPPLPQANTTLSKRFRNQIALKLLTEKAIPSHYDILVLYLGTRGYTGSFDDIRVGWSRDEGWKQEKWLEFADTITRPLLQHIPPRGQSLGVIVIGFLLLLSVLHQKDEKETCFGATFVFDYKCGNVSKV